jgi:ABC-type cobalamin/Fe3+-siderophores transport system ATPase subunit
MNLDIPITNGQALIASCEPGKPLFVLGANGAGKSALMQKLFASNSTNAYRVPAHRPNYFNSERPGMSPQQRAESGTNIRNADKNENARWQDHHSSERPSISVFDLIDSENRGSREIARAVREGDDALVQKLKKIATPLEVLNRIFRLSLFGIYRPIGFRHIGARAFSAYRSQGVFGI